MSAPGTTVQRLISADDHVDLAHPDVKAHLDPKFHDDYDAALMQFVGSMGNVRSIEANQRWRQQLNLGEPTKPVGMGTGTAGRAMGRSGHRLAADRLADMDADGVDVSVTYCEVSAFRYLYLLKDGWREATRAFNTALDEFASADPRRLVINHQIPIHDMDAAVAEVRHAASVGCKSLQLPVFPAELGLPDYWDTRYDPLWAAISDSGLPICCHIGMNTTLDDLAGRDPTPQKGIFVPMVAMSAGEALGMWIMGGVFERYPDLRVVFVEPGLGWVAWWLYIADDLNARQGYEFPALKELPSHYFHRNVFLTYIDEPDVLHHARTRLGVENVMWSSDYPHPVTSWPHSRELALPPLSGATSAERELILSGNAARVWSL